MDFFSFDDDYVRRLREGDRETAAHFHSYFRDLLFAKLRRRIASHAAVEDVVQEVFVRVWSKLGELEDARRLGAFVHAVCNHVYQEWLRRPEQSRSFTEVVETPVESPDPEGSVIDEEAKARVRRVLKRLPARDAALISAVFFEEADLDEICSRFEVDRQYLRVLLHRARERFRNEFRRKSGPLRIVDETFRGQSSLLS